MRYQQVTNKLAHIEIDYTGFHGTVATALVTTEDDMYDSNPPQYKTITLPNDCQADWHVADECECVEEPALKDQSIKIFDYEGYIIMEDTNKGESKW
jgi:hypothetical protein